MAILSFFTDQTGLIGVRPKIIYINTNDTVQTVTTAGYLNGSVSYYGFSVESTDIALVNTTTGAAWFQISITQSNSANTYSLVPLPQIGNNIAAGSNGVAGYFQSYPATASTGSLELKAVANSGNTITTISNASMGQASVVSIPDPGTATADFVVAPAALVSGNLVQASGTAGLVADAGYALHANVTASYGGGATSHGFTVTGMTASSVVIASNLTSTNAVSIVKVVPTTNTLTITWSADPGAGTTVNYIYATAAI